MPITHARRIRTLFASILATATLAGCSGGRAVPLVPAQSFGPAAAVTREAAALPAFCKDYKPFSGAGGLPITINDDSGLATPANPQVLAYLYVYSGSLGEYLRTDGTLQPLPVPPIKDATKYEFPLECFTGTGAPRFVLPAISTSHSFRVYVSYGTLSVPAGGTPSLEPTGVPAAYTNPDYGLLWDYFEYTYPNKKNPGINIDTSQVDSFALPFVLTVTASGKTTSVGTARYAQIVDAFKAASPWNALVVEGSVGNIKQIPLRIMSPDDATTRVNCANAACTTCNPVCVPYVKAFPTDYFTSSAYYKGNPGGFMGALLAYYATANDPKSPNYRRIVSVAYGLDGCNTYYDYGAGSKICPTYYAYSDGKANFEFTLRDAAGFAGLPTSVSVPASYFGYVGTINGIWGIPFAPGATIADQIQFQMYKALAADLNRGVAMQTSWHGVAPCADPSRPPSGCPTYDTAPVIPAGLNYYRDTDLVSGLPAIYNGYAAILHDNFMGGFTYAQSYDDYWGQSTDIGTGEKPSNVEVTIESMRL